MTTVEPIAERPSYVRVPRVKRTGTLEPLRDASGHLYFAGKIRLKDGSRTRVEIPESKRYSEKAARGYLAWAQEEEDRLHTHYLARVAGRAKCEAATAGAPGETCDTWFERYHAYQKELGHTDVATKRSRWFKWMSPRIGSRPIRSITRSDVEDIRDALDASILAWQTDGKGGDRVGGKTAMNVWSCLTSAFRAATSSKRRDLRVLEALPNPCVGVEPPGDKDSRKARRKTFLFPREATALLACEAIPLAWRETYAVALYTYARPGELRVLAWGDIDFDANSIAITKAWDYDAKEIKDPKSRNGVREIPIDAALAPLLRRMAEGKASTALAVPMLDSFGEDHLAEKFREHLLLAKVDRAGLHATTSTHVQSNFRSCRDSGITWLAMAGVDSAKIVRRAGHDDHNTTMGYVKLAEDLTGSLGTPFGPLPDALVSGDSSVRLPVRLDTIELFSRAGEGIRTLDVHLGKRG